jgi:hypothetical protein
MMMRADITVTYSTQVENEEQAEEYFNHVVNNLNRSDYTIEDEKVTQE